MPALEVRDVVKAYGPKVAVDRISLTVEKGEVFGLLGPNGAGKTSLIRMIMDILRPDSGEIRVLDRPVTPDLKDRLGYLPEERGLYQRQRLQEVLQYLAQLKGLSPADAARRVESYLDRVGLLAEKTKRMRELSKGMQQKAQIAAVLLTEPEFIILDEPFEGLDPVNRLMVVDLMKEACARGATIVLSSHRMDQVEALCRHVFLINSGREVLSGAVEEIRRRFADNAMILDADRDLRDHPSVARVQPDGHGCRVWLKEGEIPERFLSSLLAEGVAVRRFERSLPTLDEIFVKVVRP